MALCLENTHWLGCWKMLRENGQTFTSDEKTNIRIATITSMVMALKGTSIEQKGKSKPWINLRNWL